MLLFEETPRAPGQYSSVETSSCAYAQLDVSFVKQLVTWFDSLGVEQASRVGVLSYKQKFLAYDAAYDWLFQPISTLVKELNTEHFKFDLAGIDFVRYTEYVAGSPEHGVQDDFYDWHYDGWQYKFDGLNRKLSLTIQLSEAEEYDGGYLEVHSGTRAVPTVAPKAIGTIVAFPSFLMHRVTPITRGLRRSLVAWVLGPSFK